MDLRWSGSEAGDRLWQMLDADAWERTENPYLILQTVSQRRLEEMAESAEFRQELERTVKRRADFNAQANWFSRKYGESGLQSVAYFSMEFGLSEALPIYSGGLGILAGDFLKTAHDLGVPVTGVGLLYQQGYFHQSIAADGTQMESFPYNDPTVLPVLPVRAEDGGWLTIVLPLPGRALRLRVWKAKVGSVDLILLDSNNPLNTPWDRGVTTTLYTSVAERRLLQEISLGIGGWKALEALGIRPEICHLNEGHAAFAVLARATSFKKEAGCSFEVALRATAAGNVFTTHTSVPAGFDRFDRSLAKSYLEAFAEEAGVSVEDFLELGSEAEGGNPNILNIANLAMRSSGYVNGVARLHGESSRGLFASLYTRWPIEEVPVDHVTNGVHVPTWDSVATESLWRSAHGAKEWLPNPTDGPNLDELSDLDLWKFRCAGRHDLVEYIRRRLSRQARRHGADPSGVEAAAHSLDPNALTLGYARRFATYKRPTLLFRDMERLRRLLSRNDRPVQLVMAGKAHPDDGPGKELVKQIALFGKANGLRHRFVFLEDYDIALAQQFASGIDVWLNTPRRPWEASGTSGMKMLANGGLNLSERDGWWDEAYTAEVGWAIGDGTSHTEAGYDEEQSEQLFHVIEHEVIPEFYDRGEDGLPKRWIDRVRASMSQLTCEYSSHRMLRDYVDKGYLQATQRVLARTANSGALGAELETWRNRVRELFHTVRFGEVRLFHDGEDTEFEVQVFAGDLSVEDLSVQLYAPPDGDGLGFALGMERKDTMLGAYNGHVYRAVVSGRPASSITPRVVPHHPDAIVPLEEASILWQK
jgi:starch phosphorylase